MIMKISELIYSGYRLTYFCSEYAILAKDGVDKIVFSNLEEMTGLAIL